MAFTATVTALPNNPRHIGGFVERKWAIANTAGSTGGTVDTSFAYVHSVTFEPSSHSGSSVPQITKSAPNVTLVTDMDVDGDLVVVGRGVA